MSVYRDNHYVPQMYLRKWGQNKKVFVYRLLVPHSEYPEWQLCSIRNTAYLENIYVRIEDGKEYDDFEIDFNRQFETPVKPILDKVYSDRSLTADDWGVLCEYITAQYVRTLSFYHFVAGWGKKAIPDILQSILHEVANDHMTPVSQTHLQGNGDLIPLELHYTEQDGNENPSLLEARTVVGKNLWLYIISHALSATSPIKSEFRNMKWSIVTAPNGIIWPTCDAPVVITRIDRNRKLHITNGIAAKDRVIVFPISQTKVLLATHSRALFTWRFEADNSLAREIKASIVNNALMFIYSSIDDSDIPTIRKRDVNKLEFLRVKDEYTQWYEKYKADEAPMLTKNRTIKS